MKIIFCPSLSGHTHLDLGSANVCLSAEVLETQGLLQQLALHAGIHVEIPSYVKRLAAYHSSLMKYDRTNPDNMFHRSIAIDSMSVSKTLMEWRDALAIAGWNGSHAGISARLEALAAIETCQGVGIGTLAVLLQRVAERLQQMQQGTAIVPRTYKELELEVVCPKEMLPGYLLPVFDALECVAEKVTYGTVDTAMKPEKTTIVEFTDQYKAEAWLAMQDADTYELWLNTDNKRLDNWLHMTGQAVAGSEMVRSNPQITQMFLLAIQLFQRPLNVNTLLQYLYLPECPLPLKFAASLASVISGEGGFASDKVQECITNYLANELIKEDDKDTQPKFSPEERQKQYNTFLPFDLLEADDAQQLAEEIDTIDRKTFTTFLTHIKQHAADRAAKLLSANPTDLRIVQLQDVVTMIESLFEIMVTAEGELHFTTLQQWAQSLYETSDYRQYNAQQGSRNVISSPASMVSKTKSAVWCDFYGDVCPTLSTDFLSPHELEMMSKAGIQLWQKEAEAAFRNFALEMPLHMTTEQLTFVVCKKLGATDLPTHPLRLQLADDVEVVSGDELIKQLPSLPVANTDNHRDEDAKEVTFDATAHPVTWREVESFSSMSQLLQDPLDYFMNYILGFSNMGPSEIKMSLTLGNVAHDTIEDLFTRHSGPDLATKVMEDYDRAFTAALAKKGALLLLPAHHLDRDKLQYQLRKCVQLLAETITENELKVVTCEQREIQDLGFDHGILLKGYIDMLLQDNDGRDVVFDLKWTSKKKKFEEAIKENRATQLAIYKAMLQQHEDHPEAARTAFFAMPVGQLITRDNFIGRNVEIINPKDDTDIMDLLREGYKVRREEISSGHIETSELMSLDDIPYAQNPGALPLEQKGKRITEGGKTHDIKLKADNPYSDYKCFTL